MYQRMLYAYFVGLVVISNIILLNLIISLISDTYTKVHARSEQLNLKHRARLILEHFDFTSREEIQRLQRSSRHLHVMQPMYKDDHFVNEREKTHQIWLMSKQIMDL